MKTQIKKKVAGIAEKGIAENDFKRKMGVAEQKAQPENDFEKKWAQPKRAQPKINFKRKVGVAENIKVGLAEWAQPKIGVAEKQEK